MIVCKKCAFQNLDDDAFCGSCGGFLEWTGESVVPEAAPEAEVAAAGKRSLLSRVQTVLSLDVYAPGENPVEPATPDATPGASPAPGGPPRPGGGPTPPPRPGGDGPPARPGGPPPTRPGGDGPPTRPGGPPPTRPGGDGPPARPGGPPPTRPGGDGPPARPGGPPPSRPGGGEPPTPPTRPGSGPPPRPTSAPDPALDDADSSEAAAAATAAAAAALVARAAPARPVEDPPAEPRVVAKKAVASGERVVGDDESVTGAVTPAATEAVKPQRPADRPRPVKQKPTRKILPGDLICGDCGEGNPPTRKFCSRCGSTLAAAAVAKVSWWRKLIPHRRRKKMEAGQRPWKSADGKQKRRGGIGAFFATAFAKLRPLIAIAVLVAGLVYGVSPDIRGRVNDSIGDAKESVMSRIQKRYAPLAPIEVSATSALDDAPASLALDSNTITSWIAPGTDAEPTLVVRFDEPIDLERIKLWNGSAVGFKDHERISDIHFVFDTGQSFDLEVLDLPDGKDYEIKNGQGVREVELHIVGTYSSLSSADVGLTEVEFLIRR